MNVDKYYAHLNMTRSARQTKLNELGVINIRLEEPVAERAQLHFLKHKEGVGPNCDIKISLSTCVKEIARRGLSDPKIIEVKFLGDNLKKIGDMAFAGSSIYSITIPESVEQIGKNVFDGCEHLTEIINLSKNIEITPEVVGDCPKIQFENGHIKPSVDEITGYKR